ncbi:MAG: hypothetical protein GWN87_19275 [Desulfuromonadales bacterium]|nr:hypothetical protein [Desulfuromonadales bacterium]
MFLLKRILRFTSVAAVAVLLAAPTAAESPYERANNTWISISGEVESVSPDSFWLDYGEGRVLVEMDDGDRDADGYKLIKGDRVTVSGRIDDDFFEQTKIEAGSVYVEKLGTYFYASAMDEEDYNFTIIAPVVVSETVVQGVVTEVDSDQFTIDTAARKVDVETDTLAYNPLDDKGYQKIGVGDLVRVTGKADYNLFEGHEIKADTVVKILDR